MLVPVTVRDILSGGHFYVDLNFTGSFEDLVLKANQLSGGRTTIESVEDQLRHKVMAKAISTPFY